LEFAVDGFVDKCDMPIEVRMKLDICENQRISEIEAINSRIMSIIGDVDVGNLL